jgi:hypothetical protein
MDLPEIAEVEERAPAVESSGAARTGASPFLDLKAPASPKSAVPLKFGSFGGGASAETSVVFKLPKSASAESLSSVGSSNVPNTPVSLFGKPLQQTTPGAAGGQAPLSLFGFGSAAAAASPSLNPAKEGAATTGLFGSKKSEGTAPKFGGVFGSLAVASAPPEPPTPAAALTPEEPETALGAGAGEGEDEGSQPPAPKTPSVTAKTTPSRPAVLSVMFAIHYNFFLLFRSSSHCSRQGGLTAQQRLERRMQKFSKAAAAAPASGGSSSVESAPATADEEDGEV